MKNKALGIVLAIILFIGLPDVAVAADSAVKIAEPISSTVLVNGASVAFDAYSVDGSNYFKLRDIAYALNGTVKQFSVKWDESENAISLTGGLPYTAAGGEMAGAGNIIKEALPTASKVFLGGKEISFTAYNIEGNNYFKLRDVGQAFNFGVEWDGARNTIAIDAKKRYTPENGYVLYSKSYFGAPQGSAKILSGTNLLVSIFLTKNDSAWDDQDVNKVNQNLGVVKEFIESEGVKYGETVNLICDFIDNPDLRYNMQYSGALYEFEGDNTSYDEILHVNTNIKINDFIDNNIPYLALAEKYRTDSIAYLIFINKTGWNYSNNFVIGADPEWYHDKAFFFSAADGPPVFCAHEILHMFGANDLYFESRKYGVNDAMVSYALRACPEDIMVTLQDINGFYVWDGIVNTISPITAYYLGWLDDIPELKLFPGLRRVVPGAFIHFKE